MTTIGQKIRQARVARGLTQTDLSADVVTPGMISLIEADRARPSHGVLNAIANRLGMPVDHFLDEFDETFSIDAAFRLVEFYLMTDQPESAKAVLEGVSLNESDSYQDRQKRLLTARVHRIQKCAEEAEALLDELREQAMRVQDESLLFAVYKECGYVQYDREDYVSAIYEWENATRLGESLSEREVLEKVHVKGELLDVYLGLYAAYLFTADGEKADDCLRRSLNATQDCGRFLDFAQNLATVGEMALSEGDIPRAKSTIDRAASIMEAARFVQHNILARVRTAKGSTDGHADPWTLAAIATATTDPSVFVDAEMTGIHRAIESGDLLSAEDRISRCSQVLLDSLGAHQGNQALLNELNCRLTAAKARTFYARRDLTSAIETMRTAAEGFERAGLNRELMAAWAKLLDWYLEIGDTSEAFHLTERLSQLATASISNGAF